MKNDNLLACFINQTKNVVKFFVEMIARGTFFKCERKAGFYWRSILKFSKKKMLHCPADWFMVGFIRYL